MLFSKLEKVWEGIDTPFLNRSGLDSLSFNQLKEIHTEGIENINQGDVVALIGDFEAESIATLLYLLEKGAIVVPLTNDTKEQHSYFLEQSFCQHIFERNKFSSSICQSQKKHPLLNKLRAKGHPGLILFTTGSTGRPKAILHDFLQFIERYRTPRPSLKALSFLLFDHIGGLNTLFHILFNQGQVVSLKERTVESVIRLMNKYSIELLPTTPTFLRLLLLYPELKKNIPPSLKIISYGTERMDQITLTSLCNCLPDVDFRQTYGMSELGILRVKSQGRDSISMKIGGEGVETKVVKKILYIKSKNRMMGYLNADNPFDKKGWYCTKDLVEEKNNGFIIIIGRDSDVINVGGLKFMPSEVERVCLEFPGIKHVKAFGKSNPFTGQHVEVLIELNDSRLEIKELMNYLRNNLPSHMQPLRITKKELKISHRFKKL